MSNSFVQKRRRLPEWMTKSKTEENTPNGSAACNLLLDKEPLKYEARIIYSFNSDDCALLCDDLLTRLDSDGETTFGFDMEWPLTYKPGSESKTSLIQLCPSLTECYLFHLSCMSGLPGPLKYLLEDARCFKVGIGIESDIWKLGRDYDFASRDVIRESIGDVGNLANNVMGCKERWSLDGLCQNLLHKRLVKDDCLRKSEWSRYPLSESQKLYAATDAYASLLLYEELKKKARAQNDT